ncbi:Protein of unknown function [Magnetospira sp. QH-2]|nr:Protein of unknown function [Magnetospira sp. QH-2]
MYVKSDVTSVPHRPLIAVGTRAPCGPVLTQDLEPFVQCINGYLCGSAMQLTNGLIRQPTGRRNL